MFEYMGAALHAGVCCENGAMPPPCPPLTPIGVVRLDRLVP